MDKKTHIAGISVISNTILTLLKFFVGLISGSVSILSESIHSAIDLIASLIAFIAVRISSKEPDSKHPYGHGKFENISGVLEGALIFVAALWIIYEGVDKLIHPEPMTSLGLAAGVMFFSATLNFFVSRQLYRVAKETNSIALEADALHLKTDVYTSLGVGVGIVIIWITDLHIFDALIAILVALFIIKEAFQLIKKAFNPLLDAVIENSEFEKLNELIQNKLPPHTYINNLRARQNGAKYIIDFILNVPPLMTVLQAHDICDDLECFLRATYTEIDINIHVEPIEDKKE